MFNRSRRVLLALLVPLAAVPLLVAASHGSGHLTVLGCGGAEMREPRRRFVGEPPRRFRVSQPPARGVNQPSCVISQLVAQIRIAGRLGRRAD